MAQARVHCMISGRVQGVAFRYAAEAEARKLGVVGWVRNRRSGAVELDAEGEKDKLEQLVAWCHKGPALARVDEVEVEWLEPEGEYQSFFIGHTV